MVTLHIPQGVYYNPEHRNFYSDGHHGMGMAFWEDWEHLAAYFPQRSTPTPKEGAT